MIVERFDQCQRPCFHNLFGKGLAAFVIAVIKDDFSAQSLGIVDFDLRCVLWHHNHRGDAVQTCGMGHALGMVARGERDHALFAELWIQVRDRRPCPAEFERPRALKALGFDKNAFPKFLVQQRIVQKRGDAGLALNAFRSSADVLNVRHEEYPNKSEGWPDQTQSDPVSRGGGQRGLRHGSPNRF